jgi:hypothetical protein
MSWMGKWPHGTAVLKLGGPRSGGSRKSIFSDGNGCGVVRRVGKNLGFRSGTRSEEWSLRCYFQHGALLFKQQQVGERETGYSWKAFKP